MDDYSGSGIEYWVIVFIILGLVALFKDPPTFEERLDELIKKPYPKQRGRKGKP